MSLQLGVSPPHIKKLITEKEFIDYFKLQWLDYFNKEVLNLKGIYIKFRTNNSLENYNRQLKRRCIRKYNINLINYVDLLISEVMCHEEYIISETKKPLQKLSKNKLENKDVILKIILII